MAGMGDFLGDLGGSIGALIGWGDTSDQRDQINQAIQALMQGAQGLDPNVSTDPSTRNAQMQALAQLSNMASAGGNDPISQAAISDALGRAAQQSQGLRDATLQSMQARGMGGSGAEMAGLLSADQAGANQANSNALNAASQSRMRALQAMGSMGNLASGIRGQDWQQAEGQYQNALAKQGALSGATGMFDQNQWRKIAAQMGMDQGLGEGIGGAAGALWQNAQNAGPELMGIPGMGGGGGAGGGVSLGGNLSSGMGAGSMGSYGGDPLGVGQLQLNQQAPQSPYNPYGYGGGY